MMYERWRRGWANWPRAYRNLVVLGLICLALYLASLELDAFERFMAFVATHEDWQLDESFSCYSSRPWASECSLGVGGRSSPSRSLNASGQKRRCNPA